MRTQFGGGGSRYRRGWCWHVRAVLAAALVVLMTGCGARKEPAEESAPPAQPQATATLQRAEAAPSVPARDAVKELRVRVLEPHDQPAAGATVRVESWRGVSGFWEGRADRAGVAYVSVPAAATSMRISAVQAGYAIVSLQTNLPSGAGHVECELRVRDRGVRVVAELEGAGVTAISQCFARILPGGPLGWQHVGAAISTQCVGGRIVFPPIRAGLENLRVSVEAPGYARAESAMFHTRGGDVTVRVAMVAGVAVRGRVRYDDGWPVTAFHLRAEPRVRGREQPRAGTYAEAITPDADGWFGPLYLLQDFYRLTFTCADAEVLTTNVYIEGEETTLDVCMRRPREFAIGGIVKYSQSREPAEGITVMWEAWPGKVTNVITDRRGAFEFITREDEVRQGTLRIAHPGYAPLECHGYELRDGRPRTFFLFATACIRGTTRAEDGTALSNVFVQVTPTFSGGIESVRSYAGGFEQPRDPLFYVARERIFSDPAGQFALSNVAAPATYMMWVAHERYVYAGQSVRCSVKPGEVRNVDFVLIRKPIVYVRAVNADGSPVARYEVNLTARGKQFDVSSATEHVTSGEHAWTELSFDHRGEPSVTLQLYARTPAGAEAQTNVTWNSGDPAPYVLLTLVPGLPGTEGGQATGDCVRGFIYSHEREPLDEVRISGQIRGASAGGSALYGADTTDPLGYFELVTLRVSTASHVYLWATYQQRHFETNMWYDGTPVEWVLPRIRMVRGRVCIGHSTTPATSFWVSVDGFREERIERAEDGRFAVPLPTVTMAQEGLVRARVEGMAVAEARYSTRGEDDIDVGDIIIRDVPGRISGRVVNEHGEPVGAFVTLGADDAMVKGMNLVRTKEDDGSFAFIEVPPGMYCVRAIMLEEQRLVEAASTPLFQLGDGEEKTLPDLVVWTTNMPRVELTFVLPDGTPAAELTTPFAQQPTDERGRLVTRMKCGAYTGVQVHYQQAEYSLEEFVVTPQTRALTVRLMAAPELAGTVTIDGQPLQEGTLMCMPERGAPTGCMIRDGRFSLRAQPGRYYVTTQEGAGEVVLREGSDNVIELRRGTARLRIVAPEDQTWFVQVFKQFGDRSLPLVSGRDRMVYTGLHAGEYVVRGLRIAYASVVTGVEERVVVEDNRECVLKVGGAR